MVKVSDVLYCAGSQIERDMEVTHYLCTDIPLMLKDMNLLEEEALEIQRRAMEYLIHFKPTLREDGRNHYVWWNTESVCQYFPKMRDHFFHSSYSKDVVLFNEYRCLAAYLAAAMAESEGN